MADDIGGTELLRCRVTASPDGPEMLVLKGDLTESSADAIVNAANSRLAHGGGLARAIVRKGGSCIQHESSHWVHSHGPLAVGSAVSTSGGSLPCRFVIHTVGPNVARLPKPTRDHAQQLRNAVWSALEEADRLELRSVAIPGISTGAFGYPRDQGAREIVGECARFCCERSSSSVRVIGLMNFDDPTVVSFVKAAMSAARAKNWSVRRSFGLVAHDGAEPATLPQSPGALGSANERASQEDHQTSAKPTAAPSKKPKVSKKARKQDHKPNVLADFLASLSLRGELASHSRGGRKK